MNYTWQTQIVDYAKGGGFGIFGSTFDDWGWLESDGIEFSGAGHFSSGSDACD